MFKKKLNYEEFVAYKDEVEVELGRLRDEIKALQEKAGVKKKVKKVEGLTSKSPVKFFESILKYLYESDDVFYDNGNFFDGDGSFIAQRKGDASLRVSKTFLTGVYVENYPPAKRVGRGFYKYATDLGVLYRGEKTGAYHTSLTSDEGEKANGVVIHDDFLNKYKNGGF